MKGIVLAGGAGTRLYPTTKIYSKQLSLIYDKPLIYYPVSLLMLGGVKEVLIISNEETIPLYKKLFEDGSQIGMKFEYVVQDAPNGIAEAFILGEDFIGDDSATLVLGDNIFYGKLDFLYNALENHQSGGTIFAYQVTDPQRYGIVEFDKTGKAISIEEKPSNPKSEFAVPGLYVYDNEVIEISKNLKPSARGELEITDVNKVYLEREELKVQKIGRGVAWLDTGTPEALLQASQFFGVIEDRQGLKVACLEEIALKKGFISLEQYEELLKTIPNSLYKDYLLRVLKEEK
ncbi:MAG: glucose-1-phosphate thymidylyltransferase RfbA [Melioribacteraceae bacterium]|nr:glucose-1-phosphate thymidylyltransferase RfbA [Melioribacteraceae bacterium]MCF8356122.1 glucose-1-phosphate thymidylyltransferase RfbA [Melioribacteraceae bacterium]MCF8395904.1 glucose-1-phosphate thymidylyltransferase RfbA [Melioribacteraceae bacterium]MCF8420989.1 glucose-1-phosphate thymidylyltransferase RfbA [Melioribacteraceae bacterium]